jgi:CheY-like chemotaxis protein
LRFPATAPPDLPKCQALQTPSKLPQRTVLVVDDNETLRLTLHEQLASLNCFVREAASFQDALTILQSDAAIDFILSDLDLGIGPDGIALAQWVLGSGKPIPGAIMSGHLTSLVGLPEEWRSLTKPIQLNDLRALLAAARVREQESVQAPATGSPVILVVEDNFDMRFIAGEILKRRGYRLAEAATGQEALRKLESDPAIRLVLCDLGLPDMSGRRLAEEIRKLYPAAGVLLMSGTLSPSALMDDGLAGQRILQKPFTRESLARFVEEGLARLSS